MIYNFLRAACVPAEQRKFAGDRFKKYMLRTTSGLGNRMEHLRAVAAKHSPWAGTETEGDRGDADLLEAAGQALSSVLSAHLVLCRMALLFSWSAPFYTGAPESVLEEIGALASRLVDAWRLLGVSGEARRQILKRLVVVVGQQTLEARQRVHERHQQLMHTHMASLREIRSDVALAESEGERGAG